MSDEPLMPEAGDPEDAPVDPEDAPVDVDGDDEGGAPANDDPVVALEAERDELRGTLQRVQADFENFRKRTMRDQADQAARAHEGLVGKLLPVLDSFELAVLNIPSGDLGEAGDKLKKGVELVYAEFFSVLEREGLSRIDAVGKPFDPEEHEAVMRDEGPGDPIVTEQMRAGYRLQGRVVRPAMVRVGPPPG